MTLPLLTTKLHRPLTPSLQVPRPHLLAKLNQGLARGDKLLLTVAPAGFGKTTLISQWIDQNAALGDTSVRCIAPPPLKPQFHNQVAWLALNEADNDLALFLQEVVAAVRAIYPTACANLLYLLQASQLAAVPHLATILQQELGALPPNFVLVLEDYHFVTQVEVHQLLTLLLDHLPSHVHLVLISRTEPPLPLARLRVGQQMTELRTADLYFSLTETQTFLAQALDRPLAPETVITLHRQTEGWIAGLQLAALALRGGGDEAAFVKTFADGNRHVMDYLMGEVLARQPQTVQTFLLYTSVLDRFCAPLCEAVLGDEQEGSNPAASLSILTYLGKANLFVVALDDEDKWYRYHHLFRALLRRRLHASIPRAEISTLHCRASAWLADNGWVEEAVRQALASGDNLTAARLVTEHRQEMFDREEWRTLERWLGLLPTALVVQDAALLIIKAFVYSFQFKLSAIPPLLQAAATRLEASTLTDPAASMLRGELAGLWSQHWFWQNEYGRSLAAAEQGMKHLSATHLYAQSGTLFYWGLAAQMLGQRTLAVQTLQATLSDQPSYPNTLSTRVLFALSLIHYFAGELAPAQQMAQDFLQVARQSNLALSEAWAHYLLGMIHYEWNELEHAAHHFSAVVSQRYAAHTLAVHNCWLALAWTQQAQGRQRQAGEQVTELLNFHYERNNLALLPGVHAFRARLALQQGDMRAAISWAQATELTARNGPLINFDLPPLTHAKVLLAQATSESRAVAMAELAQLQDVLASTHNTLHLIEVLALQALAASMQGETESALTTLAQAVRLAKPGGFIRTFVDLGPALARLLYQLVARGVEIDYLGPVLAAFPPTAGTAGTTQQIRRAAQAQMIEPLTERESEVLLYLKQGLSNKAIAHTLNISVLTVKKHTINLYQKLGVNSRQQANVKAQALGILPLDSEHQSPRA